MSENKESYQMDEVSKKEEEASEDTPLKANDKDVEGGPQTDISETKENEKAVMASVEEKGDDKQSSGLLEHPKIKLVLAIVGALLLVLLLLIVAILVIIYRDSWSEDQTWRYIRLIPKPNGPQNLIYFRHGHMPLEGRVWPDLVRQLEDTINNYRPEVALGTRNVTECLPGTKPKRGQVCLFDTRQINDFCTKGDFGYASGTPCIFIQFNNISDWEPDLYTQEDFMSNNTELPQALSILNARNLVFIECRGNTIIDQENMGPIEYSPTQGFPDYYFPYTGHPDYMPPFVAIRFKSPTTSIAIGITCKLYAKNLNYNVTESGVDGAEPVPSVQFNLFIE